MNKKRILAEPSRKRRDEFLAAVKRSRKLHGRWASPPTTPEMFDAYLERLRRETYLGYWVQTDRGELAGVFNINENEASRRSRKMGHHCGRVFSHKEAQKAQKSAEIFLSFLCFFVAKYF